MSPTPCPLYTLAAAAVAVAAVPSLSAAAESDNESFIEKTGTLAASNDGTFGDKEDDRKMPANATPIQVLNRMLEPDQDMEEESDSDTNAIKYAAHN